MSDDYIKFLKEKIKLVKDLIYKENNPIVRAGFVMNMGAFQIALKEYINFKKTRNNS